MMESGIYLPRFPHLCTFEHITGYSWVCLIDTNKIFDVFGLLYTLSNINEYFQNIFLHLNSL